jgi:sugar lactone lactonase YvrE
LFVALDFLGDGLYELDPELVEPPRLMIETLGFLNAFDFGPDGFLYGPIVTQGKVVRIDVDTAEMTTVAQDFALPVAAKFDSAGQLYVGDQLKGEVVRVDPSSGEKMVVATGLQGLDNLALNAQDRLFVSSATDGFIVEVIEISSEGKIRPVSPGGMMKTRGVAVLSGAEGDSVFVADQFTLREFDLQTGEPLGLERNYIGVPGITSPQTVAADGAHLIVSSGFGNVVQVWDPAAKMVLEEYPDFVRPANAIRFQGDLIVAEGGTGKVVRAGAAGYETLLEGLERPYGLTATEDALWAGDWAAGTIWQLAAGGAPLAEPVPIATGLAGPEGLAVARDGRLLVLEGAAGRLSAIDLETGQVNTVTEGFAVDAAGETLNGIAVDASGAVCVSESIANVLYRVEMPF